MTHDEYVKMLKSTVTNLVVKSVLSILVRQFSWMSLGPLYGMVSWVVVKIITIAVNETELAIFLRYTDIRVNQQGKAFNEAAAKNFAAQQSGTPEEKAAAEKELIEKFRAFVKLQN